MNRLLLDRQGAIVFAAVYLVLASAVGILLELAEAYYGPGARFTAINLANTVILISITGIALYALLRVVVDDNRKQRQLKDDAENAYQQLFRTHPHPMFLYNPANRHILDANDAAVLRYGWSCQEFKKMRADDVQYGSSQEELDAYFNSFPNDRVKQHIGAQRQVDRSGTPFWAEVTTHPVDFEATSMQLVTCVDINFQVEAAREAYKALKHLEDAEQLGRFGAWEWHPGQHHITISRGMAELFGLDANVTEEPLRSAFARILPEDRPRAREAAERCLREGYAEVQFRATLSNGDVRHYREILHTQTSGSADFVVTGSVIDETDQIMYTRDLERQESDLHTILASLPTPVVLHETGDMGRIHMANPAFYCMLGVPAGEETSIKALFELGSGDAAQNQLRNLTEAVESQYDHAQKLELTLKRRNGAIFRVLIHALHLNLSDKRLVQLVIHDVDDETVLRERLRQANDNLTRLNSNTINVLEQERALISRELHDDIGQLLIAVKTNLRALVNKWPASNTRPHEAELISDILAELVAKVRDRSLMLRPPQLDELGLKHAITWEMRRVLGPTTVHYQFHDKLKSDQLPTEPSLTAFRIFQEAMTNAVRHGKLSKLDVTLESTASELRLMVEDDGLGFDIDQQQTGLGLANMKERAALANGTLTIKTACGLGSGTRVEARLPLQHAHYQPTPEGQDAIYG